MAKGTVTPERGRSTSKFGVNGIICIGSIDTGSEITLMKKEIKEKISDLRLARYKVLQATRFT